MKIQKIKGTNIQVSYDFEEINDGQMVLECFICFDEKADKWQPCGFSVVLDDENNIVWTFGAIELEAINYNIYKDEVEFIIKNSI